MAPPETSAASPEPIAALCERVRSIAQAAGEEGLRARHEQAETLVAEARRRAAADGEDQRRRAEEQLQKQAARELQNARLEARALRAKARWAELDSVLDAAEREVTLIRASDPKRYTAALVRFLQAACEQIAAPLLVKANAEDARLLRDHLPSPDPTSGFVEVDVGAGIVATVPDGNVVCDQTIASRRRRLDGELRLAAEEILFAQRERTEERESR